MQQIVSRICDLFSVTLIHLLNSAVLVPHCVYVLYAIAPALCKCILKIVSVGLSSVTFLAKL